MKKILALTLALVMVLAMAACGAKTEAPAEAPAAAPAEAPAAAPAAEAPAAAAPAAAPAGNVTWADYQAYLIEKTSGNAPDPEAFKQQVEALSGWEDIDQTSPPWDQMFSTLGLSTWEEFQNGIVKDSQVVGLPTTGEPSGEATGEPAA